MSDEPTMPDMDALTADEWLAVRKAAIQWAEQVHGGMPGPEPLMAVVQGVIASHVLAALIGGTP